MKRLTGLLLLGVVGCAEDTSVDALGNHYPEVLSWSCSPDVGLLPVTTTCAWQIRDVDQERISCAFDVGADATVEQSIDDCPAEGSARFDLTTPGNVPLRLTLTDWRGAIGASDAMVNVAAPPNVAPTVTGFTADPLTGGTPLPVTFQFTVADQDGDALTCRLLDGDQVISPAAACGTGDTRTATLTEIRTHVISLEVADAKGGRATKDLGIVVTALPQVGDLRISKVEYGQTVMSTAPRLVAGKDALLRVYALSERSGISGVTVKVEASSNGTALGELNLTGPGVAPTAENPADLSQQWRATLPAAWVGLGLSLRIRVDPSNLMGETNETNNEVISAPVIGAGNVLPVTHVPIIQSGRTGTPRQIEQAMKQIWPLKGVDSKVRAAYTFNGTISATGGGWDTLLDQLAQVRQNDGSRRDYLGWISVGFGSGVAGLGYVGLGAALTRDDEVGTSVHELGHNMGRDHAPCGGASGTDRNYPVANAHLDLQGFDFVSSRVISATQSYDVMSYCDPIWVSNYNYRAVQTWLESHPVSSSAPITSAPRIVVSGQLQKGRVTLHPLTLIEGPADSEVEPGDYTLTLHGEQTVRIPFAVNRVADGLDDAHFSLLVPPVPGLYAAEISLGGQQVALRVAGIAKPAQKASVRRVSGGVELSWDAAAFPYASLAHLGDEGHTTLTLWAEGGKAFVSTRGLADGGAFEVSLSDGVQSQRLVLPR